MRKIDAPKGTVVLVGYDAERHVVIEANVSYNDYYEGSTRLIDDPLYRAGLGVRLLTGRIFDGDGRLQSEFEVSYGATGEVVSAKQDTSASRCRRKRGR